MSKKHWLWPNFQQIFLDEFLSWIDRVTRDLIPPEPVLVEACKAVDNDGYGEGETEHSRQGAESRKHLSFFDMTSLIVILMLIQNKLIIMVATFPSSVLGLESYPTVVMVINPHLSNVTA